MTAPPDGISEVEWLSWPPSARAIIVAQREEIKLLRGQLSSMATELVNLRERIRSGSRKSSKPPSSNSQGFEPPKRRQGRGRKRDGQPGHPGSGPELLPIERVDEVVEHHPEACRRCGTLPQGEDPERLVHQVIEIPPITARFTEHRRQRMICPCCSTITCSMLPADGELRRYGPRLSALVGLLGSAFPLSFWKPQALLDQLLGVEISRGTIALIRECLRAALEQPFEKALELVNQQLVAPFDETFAPIGNGLSHWRSLPARSMVSSR